jgi:hypothetical protein
VKYSRSTRSAKRRIFARRRFPEHAIITNAETMPDRMHESWFSKTFFKIFDWVLTLPQALQPAMFSALILFVLTAARMVVVIPMLRLTTGTPKDGWLPYFTLPVLAAAAGALGGFVYTFIGKPLRSIPRIGPYMAGIVTVMGYYGAIVALVRATGATDITDPALLVIFGFFATGIGIALGHTIFKPMAR